MQKHELCSATMWTPPLESTHRELSFEWSHLEISLDLDLFFWGSEGVKAEGNLASTTQNLLFVFYDSNSRENYQH